LTRHSEPTPRITHHPPAMMFNRRKIRVHQSILPPQLPNQEHDEAMSQL
jgi:hypothetical protein